MPPWGAIGVSFGVFSNVSRRTERLRGIRRTGCGLRLVGWDVLPDITHRGPLFYAQRPAKTTTAVSAVMGIFSTT
jgi:hypothetical protein